MVTIVNNSFGRGKVFPRLINDAIRTGPWSTTTELEHYTSKEIENGYVVAKSIDERYKCITEKDEFKDNNRLWIAEQYEDFIATFEGYMGFSSSLLAQHMRDCISAIKLFAKTLDDNTMNLSEAEDKVYDEINSIRILLSSIEQYRTELHKETFVEQSGAQ